jgi:glucose uptake protein
MILPHTNTSVLLILLLSLVCLGSWANLYKLAGKWRYELFYFDFAIGLVIASMILAFTFGNLGFDGFNAVDDLMNAGKRQWMFGFLAAIIFNFGNMLLLAATSLGGMAVAFPMAYGVALIIGGLRTDTSGAGTLMLIGGCVLVAASIVFDAMAYSQLNILKHEAAARAGKAASTRRPSSLKGIILALVGGLLLGLYSPLLNRAQDPDIGLGPYSLAMIFSLAVAFSAFVLNLFLMNLPVEGDPIEIVEYFRAAPRKHGFGLLAGAVFAIGLVCSFVGTAPKGDTHLGMPLAGFLTLSVPVVAGCWGLFVWKEFRSAETRVKLLALATLILLAAGIAALAVAPGWTRIPTPPAG